MRRTPVLKVNYLMASAVLTAAVFALRTWGLTSTSLWYDEIFILQHAQAGPLHAIVGLLKEDNALPLHGLLTALWVSIAGHGEFSARYLSVLLGTAATPLIMRLSSSLSQKKYGGIGSGLAYATLPICVYYTQEVRMYALAIPLAAAFAWVSIRLYRTGHHSPLYIILGLCMLATHIYTGLLWAVCLVWGLVSRMSSKPHRTQIHNYRLWLHANIVMMLGVLPIGIWAVWRVNADATATSAIPLEVLKWLPITFGIGQYIPTPGADIFALLTLVSLLTGCVILIRNRHIESAVWTGLVLVLPLVLLMAASIIKAKWSERYLLPSFGLGLVTTAGLGWELLFERSRQLVQHPYRAWSARLLTISLVSLWIAGTLPALKLQTEGTIAAGIQDEWHPRPDFRGVADYIQEHDSPKDAVVVVAGYAAYTLDYYYDGPAKLFGLPLDSRILDTRASLDLHALQILEKQTQGYNNLWVVLWQERLSDPTNLIGSTLVAACKRLPVSKTFTNIGVMRFDLTTCRPLDQTFTPKYKSEMDFVESIRFMGYDIHKQDGLWEILLWWASTGTIEKNYTIFVHLLNAEGEIIVQNDHIAGADAYPTSQWREGTYLRNRFFLELSSNSCDNCVISTGLYTDDHRLVLKNGQDSILLNVDQ
jgi:hypothetical protein